MRKILIEILKVTVFIVLATCCFCIAMRGCNAAISHAIQSKDSIMLNNNKYVPKNQRTNSQN